LLLLINNIDLKIIQEVIENLFPFELDIAWNYLWFCCEKDTSALLPNLWKVRGGNVPDLRRTCLPLSAVTVSLHYLPRCLCSNGTSHAAKRLLS